MTSFTRAVAVLAFLLSAMSTYSANAQSEISVISSGGFAAPLYGLIPKFEERTGIKVIVTLGQSQGTAPNLIGTQLKQGVPCDVVVMSKEGLNGLISQGRIRTGSEKILASSPMGMSVRTGAEKPDISSIDAFKQTLLRASSITFPDSTTGIYMMTTLFPRLGIDHDLAPKTTHTGVAAVAAGQAELALQPVSELMNVQGTDFVGLLPKDAQYVSFFSTAVVSTSAKIKQAQEFVAYLSSREAAEQLKSYGMQPVEAQ